jgi:hypothetical protein
VRQQLKYIDQTFRRLGFGGTVPRVEYREVREPIVVKLPLEILSDETGPLRASRLRRLSSADVLAMVRTRPHRFAIANTGYPLRWIPTSDCYDFWITEVQPHIPVRSRPYTREYHYFATEWQLDGGERVVVLEMRQ